VRRLASRRFGLGLLGLAALLIGAPSAAPAPRSSVVTLLAVNGSIDGFAQDGDRIVWSNADDPCKRGIHIRALSTGTTRNLPACDEGWMQHRMALAGMRALWATVIPSIQTFQFEVYTAAAGDRKARSIGDVGIEGGVDNESAFRPVPLAGDGATLAYADISDDEGHEGAQGVFRVARGRTYLPATEDTSALAASGRRLALARFVWRGCVCNDSPSWSPDGRRILFLSTRGGGGHPLELYSMNADGSGLRRLTSTGGRVGTGSWSPDGRALVYDRHYPDSNQIFRASADGRRVRPIARGYDPQWSPDGRFIAYSSYVPEADDIFLFVVPARGGKPRRLTKEKLQGATFTWSPDSKRIAVVPGDTGLSVVKVASRSTKRIVRGRAVDGPAWSPDGTRIAYCVSGTGGRYELHVIRANGTGDVRLAQTGLYNCEPEWSPDSGTIAFTVGAPAAIHVIPAGGGTQIRLGPGRSPEWSSDGGNIAYVTPGRTEEEGEIARIAADGSAQQALTSTEAASKRNALEIRLASGRIVSEFDTPVLAAGVALSRSHVALLIRSRGRFKVEIRTLKGALVRAASVRRPTGDEISMSRRWVVFRTGRVIRALDVRSGRQRVLARAEGYPVGLSIEGRRVAWAEQGSRTSSIRAVFLP
jgi:Tol biopolymer transport system component